MGVMNPTRRLENRLYREQGHRIILGVDEVGVAPSAGPVVACALAMPLDKRFIKGVRDSKMLSAQQRDRLAKHILRQAVRVGLGAASVREIDSINIYYATVLAMQRAVARAGDHDFVIVDGRKIRGFEQHAGPYQAMIDGDARCYAVACASIVAKVTRDRLMRKLSVRYPWYGWEHNAGYPTQDHRAGMTAHGVTAHHRRSFITTQRALSGEQVELPLFETEADVESIDELDVMLPSLETELVPIGA
jgi:ribonuclease HII